MKVLPSFLDELRERISPSEVIKKRVQLKHNGREFSGLCPFHKENTPSFTVSDDKGFYHCFGCGAHGDIIKFVMETENVPFIDAVTTLASQAGMQMPKEDPQQTKIENQKQSFYQIMDLAASWFSEQLTLASAANVKRYLGQRNINEQAIKKFRLGYAPNAQHTLKQLLISKGISEETMVTLGLISPKSRKDYFRNRLIFPITDVKGHVIAFGGRILGEGQPKYLNSPETPLFKKGTTLYNEQHAKALARKSGKLVIVEGYMDVIALDTAGIKSSVAPLGTAVTSNQIHRLWTMASEPVFCFDGDNAGKRAMSRAAIAALSELKPGYSLRFASLPAGMDPDDYVKSKGIDNLRNILRSAESLSDVLWESELLKKDVSTPEGKADLEQRLSAITNKINNTVINNYYKKFFNNKLWNLGRNILSKKGAKQLGRLNNLSVNNDIDLNTCQGCEVALIYAVFNHPELLENNRIKDEFVELEFFSNTLDKIRVAILEVFDIERSVSKHNVCLHLEKSGLSAYMSYLDSISLHFFSQDLCNLDVLEKGWNYIMKKYNLAHLRMECHAAESSSATNSGDRAAEFRKQIQQVEHNIRLVEVEFGDQA